MTDSNLRQQAILLVLTGVFALACLIGSPYPKLAPLQNLPTLFVLAVAWLGLRRFPMPTSAIACFCLFLALHTLGGRYIYSNVPYDAWFSAIGLPAPTELFHFERNHYDRIVHFSFGLLMLHPLAEGLARFTRLSRGWATYVAIEFVLAGSALYEIFEWGLTLTMAGENADAYNGQQGDIWDAQKDMALAFAGAIVAALFLRLRGRSATD